MPSCSTRPRSAATSLGDEAALDLSDVLAEPFIVMRNDHQDALGAGLAVTEYAPAGKSAEEIRGLWKWVEKKLGVTAPVVERLTLNEFRAKPDFVPTMFLPAPAEPSAIAG